MARIFIDADACPVKDEIYRAAGRYGLKTFVVANQHLELPLDEHLEGVRVGGGPDAADDWIAERCGAGDLVVTDDLPLAGRSIDRGAQVLTSRGNELTERNIGEALATRDLMQELREAGLETGGPSSFSKKDRGAFSSRLDACLHRLTRDG